MSERNPKLTEIDDAALLAEVTGRALVDEVLRAADGLAFEAEAQQRGYVDASDEDCSVESDCGFDPREIDRAYLALTPETPEPIRELILELSGRIA